MKIPTMTKRKHWLYLFGIMFVEAILAFGCFMAGPPISYVGLILVGLANLEFIVAMITAIKSGTKK